MKTYFTALLICSCFVLTACNSEELNKMNRQYDTCMINHLKGIKADCSKLNHYKDVVTYDKKSNPKHTITKIN